jgi:uncharacterized protein
MKSQLSQLTIATTYRCNLGCRYCYAGGGNYYSGLKIDTDDRTVEQVIELVFNLYDEVLNVMFFGGEPLLNFPLIKHTIAYINKHQKKPPQYSIITNGTIFTEEIMSFIKNNKIRLVISLDGPKWIHNENRPFKSGKGSFDIIKKNINNLRKKGIEFEIETTYTAKHIDNGITVISLIEYFRSIGASKVNISTEIGIEKGKNDNYKSKIIGLFIDAIKYSMDVFKKEGIFVLSLIEEVLKSFSKEKDKRIDFCPAGYSVLAFDPLGNPYPCHMFFNKEKFILKNRYTNVIPTKLDFDSCKRCSIKDICTSCIGRMYFTNENIIKPNEFDCTFKKAATKEILLQLSKLETF